MILSTDSKCYPQLDFLKSTQPPTHALLQPSPLSTAGSQSTVGSLSLAGSQFIAGFSIHGQFSVHSRFLICSWLSISSWFSIHSWFSSTAGLSSQLVCNPQLILNFLIHSWYWQPFKDIMSVWLLCQQMNMTWRVRTVNHTHSWWDPGDWSHGWWNKLFPFLGLHKSHAVITLSPTQQRMVSFPGSSTLCRGALLLLLFSFFWHLTTSHLMSLSSTGAHDKLEYPAFHVLGVRNDTVHLGSASSVLTLGKSTFNAYNTQSRRYHHLHCVDETLRVTWRCPKHTCGHGFPKNPMKLKL